MIQKYQIAAILYIVYDHPIGGHRGLESNESKGMTSILLRNSLWGLQKICADLQSMSVSGQIIKK